MAMNRVQGHLRVQQQPGAEPRSTVNVMLTGIPLSCCARPPTHPFSYSSLSDSQGLALILKVPARSSKVNLSPLTLTQVPPKPLSLAPEQHPDPREQAVHQGDTGAPPLSTVRAADPGVGSSCISQCIPQKAAEEMPVTRIPKGTMT